MLRALLIAVCLSMLSAPAAARPTWWLLHDKFSTFLWPQFNGMRLDWCYSRGTQCGKPAADAFCKMKGRPNAVEFEFEPDVGPTRIIGTGQVCNHKSCDGFKVIVCESTKTEPVKPTPQVEMPSAGKPAPRMSITPNTALPAMQIGVDRPGGDYHGFALSAAQPGLCKQACESDKLCRAWTYVKPGIKGPSATCYLKKTVPPPHNDTCCVSGVK